MPTRRGAIQELALILNFARLRASDMTSRTCTGVRMVRAVVHSSYDLYNVQLAWTSWHGNSRRVTQLADPA